MELPSLVVAFADAIKAVDERCAPYVSRSGREYQVGIRPYAENRAMELVAEELNARGLGPCGQFAPYPNAPRQKCDLWIGAPPEWVVEVKMGRFRGDNGKPDDTGIKDLISPFRQDRSALADGVKLAVSGFEPRQAVLVYGFDDDERPLADAPRRARPPAQLEGPHERPLRGRVPRPPTPGLLVRAGRRLGDSRLRRMTTRHGCRLEDAPTAS